MDPWTFYDFLDGAGDNLIRAWLDSLPAKASAKIDARLRIMEAMQGVWPPQYVSSLQGWPDLMELRIVSDGNQYRPIGFYGPSRGEFTIVLGAIEKGRLPKRVLEGADANRKIVLSDRNRIVRHVFRQGATGQGPQDQ
jgi:hypothetical protein